MALLLVPCDASFCFRAPQVEQERAVKLAEDIVLWWFFHRLKATSYFSCCQPSSYLPWSSRSSRPRPLNLHYSLSRLTALSSIGCGVGTTSWAFARLLVSPILSLAKSGSVRQAIQLRLDARMVHSRCGAEQQSERLERKANAIPIFARVPSLPADNDHHCAEDE